MSYWPWMHRANLDNPGKVKENAKGPLLFTIAILMVMLGYIAYGLWRSTH